MARKRRIPLRRTRSSHPWALDNLLPANYGPAKGYPAPLIGVSAFRMNSILRTDSEKTAEVSGHSGSASLEAPERVILTPNSCAWAPVWSEEHSLSYVTIEDRCPGADGQVRAQRQIPTRISLEIGSFAGMMTTNRGGWISVWSEEHSPSYVTSENRCPDGRGQVSARRMTRSQGSEIRRAGSSSSPGPKTTRSFWEFGSSRCRPAGTGKVRRRTCRSQMLRVKLASRAAPVLFSQGGLAPLIVDRSARAAALYGEAAKIEVGLVGCSERCTG